jgi:Cache 3/Cache 2 fusion domain
MRFFHFVTAAALTTCATLAFASDPQATIKQLDDRLYKIGAPKLDGTVEVRDKVVPAIFFGARRINNNYDVVDEIKKTTGATATVFVRDGEEFVRVSTNVLTPEGKRGVGTQLARNKAYEAVNVGKSYCGDIDVLGTAYSACYNPIKDSGGKVIGVTYIGHKK